MTEQPNFLLVTVDSLRADHVHEDLAATRNLDALAADGVAFESAFAQGPYTTFSMPSLFTSRYPSQLTSIAFVEGVEGVLVDGAPTIQEHLADAGYTTIGVHSNPLLSGLFGFDVGFDRFYDGLGGLSDRFSGRLGLIATKVERLLRRHAYVPAARITDVAIEHLDAVEGRPLFLWVHYMDAHGPYQSKSGPPYVEKYRAEWLWRKAVHSPEEITEEERETLRETYAEEVAYTDAEIGRLLETFEQQCGEDGLVVCTADHGEEFGEHGSYSHESKVYDELIHVPLLVDPPADMEVASERSDALTPLLDVGATIADAAGAAAEGFEGTSLFAEQPGGADAPTAPETAGDQWIVSEAKLDPDYVGAIRTPAWKLVRDGEGGVLYDLASDPAELTDVAEANPDVAEDLANALDAHRERTAGDRRADAALDSDELEDQLRSLGYIE